ncbi:helix-turn-helix domain-containing protein [Verrucomicrobiota bacterium sgz303538]
MRTQSVSILTEKLSQSEILRDYEKAFSEATGMPLEFRMPGKKRPGIRNKPKVNPFCVQLSETDPGCRMCVDMQQRLTDPEAEGTRSGFCAAGLTDAAVPVKVGDQLLGYLSTGQVALRELTREDFRRVIDWLKKGGAKTDWEELEKSFFETKIITRQQYDAVLKLLEVFAQHLSIAAEQIATHESHAEPPMVQQARKFIEEHQDEELALEDVAKAVNTSTFHFCKMFKKATGMTFTEYLGLIRVGKAKKLLANPQKRISEIAFEAGFSSLTHFNRTFRKITGQSPTAFRRQVAGAV